MKNPILFVLNLNPFNYCFAYLWSFWGTVVYENCDQMPTKLCKRFLQIDPNEFYDRPSWIEIQEDVFKLVKSEITQKDFKLDWQLEDYTIDYKSRFFQWYGRMFLDYYCFLKLAEKWTEKHFNYARCYIAGTFVHNWKIGPRPPLRNDLFTEINFFYYLERLWQWCFSILVCFQQLRRCYGQKQKVIKQGIKIKHIFTGIGPREFSTNSESLDFSFLCNRPEFDPEQAIYVLPCYPNQEQANYLKKRNIFWVVEKELSCLLNRQERAIYCKLLLTSLFKSFFIFKNRNFQNYLLPFILRSLIWHSLQKKYRFANYISTLSAFWPESPAVCVLNAMNVRTITWFYASSEFEYFSEKTNFKNFLLEGSIPSCREFWLWNKMHAETLQSRQITKVSSKTKYVALGTLMCGNSAWVNTPQSDLKTKFGIANTQKCIVCYDVPLINIETRTELSTSIIPTSPMRHTHEVSDTLYQDLEEYLQQNPDITLAVKLKRPFDDPIRQPSKELQRLLETDLAKQSRIILLDAHVDTYISIGLADICLGLAPSSPVLAGFSFEKSVLLYDPLFEAKYIVPPELGALMVHGKQNFFSTLDKWKQNPHEFQAKQQNLKNSSRWKGLPGDPLENFTKLLYSQSI